MRAFLHLLLVVVSACIAGAVGAAIGVGATLGTYLLLPQGDYGPRQPALLLLPVVVGVGLCCAGFYFGGRFAYRRVERWLPLT